MLKRSFDLLLAAAGLLLLWPALFAIAVAVWLDSPGPVFYRGVRTGLNGRPFRIFKFRSMVPDAEAVGGPSTAMNDPRLTRVGKFLRRLKLDELPQLFNVFLADMSFVGPRPQVEKYTKLYSGEEKLILTVRPGITDYASLRFINLDEILGDGDVDEKYLREIEPEKNRLRIHYAKNRSFWTDAEILFKTILGVLGVKSTWNTKS